MHPQIYRLIPYKGLKGYNRSIELILNIIICKPDGHQIVLLVLRKIQNIEPNKNRSQQYHYYLRNASFVSVTVLCEDSITPHDS